MEHLTKNVLAAGLVMATALIVDVDSAQAAFCAASNLRWAASSNNLYVMGADTVCTLTELDALADKANIQLVDSANKTWFVGSNIWLQQGATLNLHGAEAGGDVDELKLKSDSGVVFLRAYWGTIDIRDTKITSWTGRGPDNDSANPRAHIQAKSFLEGSTPRVSTMNIVNSDIGYLGYNAAESYGLSWKVIGSSPGLFDQVGVRGTVTNSRIHHNYYGAYTWGADAMVWDGNEFDHNKLYGLDPHDNSDNLVIVNNRFHLNGTHGMICSRYCDHLIIRRNQAYDNGGNGFMLHRLTNESLVEDNEAYDNADSGLAIFDSHTNTIRRNFVHDNGKGMRFSVGSSHNLIDDNDIVDNIQYGLYFFKGSDAPTESGDGRPKRNQFTNNRVTGSGIYGIKLKEADANLFANNQFVDNGQTLLLESARGNRFEDNRIADNASIGLTLSGALDHVVTGNTIANNDDIGVLLKNGSHRATITNNNISGHGDYGILVKSSNDVDISGNTFSHNGKDVGP